MKTEITRTITETIIQFKAYNCKDDEIYHSDYYGYETTAEKLAEEVEKKYNSKILKITNVTKRKFKLTIDLNDAVNIGTLTEIN